MLDNPPGGFPLNELLIYFQEGQATVTSYRAERWIGQILRDLIVKFIRVSGPECQSIL